MCDEMGRHLAGLQPCCGDGMSKKARPMMRASLVNGVRCIDFMGDYKLALGAETYFNG
jgi:hypothetical protein